MLALHDQTSLLGFQFLDELDVLLLCILLAHTLSLVPGFPLVFALEIKHARLCLCVVTNSSLLEESIELRD